MSTKEIGPRIYNLFPLLVGDGDACRRALPRVAAMAFDHVYLNPIWYPGFSGSLYAVKDFDRLHPAFDDGSGRDAETQIAAFCDAAHAAGLRVVLDLVINHTSKDAVLVAQHPDWFELDEQGEPKSPSAIDPANADNVTVWGDLAELDWHARPARDAMTRFFTARVRRWIAAGVDGFRCDAAYKVPAAVWAALIDAARAQRADVTFAAETLGCRIDEVEALRKAGFDYLFNSVKWWDLREKWLLEQYAQFRDVAPSIGFPESHDTERLVCELAAADVEDPTRIEAAYRRAYAIAATFSTGVMMPVGYEYGFRRRLDVVESRPELWEAPLFDLSGYITAINVMKARVPALNVEGPQRRLAAGQIVALLRRGAGESWALTLINPDLHAEHTLAVGTLDLPPGEAAVEVTPDRPAMRLDRTARLVLAPAEVRVFATGLADARAIATPIGPPARRAAVPDDPVAAKVPAHPAAHTTSQRVVIQKVQPEIDGGRYAIKREVGDALEVEATIFSEGHAHLGAALLIRPARDPQATWHRVPMARVDAGLDRWRASAPLEQNTRYAYTVEAWRDDFASWRDGTEKKRAAGQQITLELAEGRAAIMASLDRVAG
ncbi:MAG: maltotransferase domain-containing protein, partial [bacterium]